MHRSIRESATLVGGLAAALLLAVVIPLAGSGRAHSDEPDGARAQKKEAKTMASEKETAGAAKAKSGKATATAIFGAGCFWGVEKRFGELEGVVSTETGYAGGHAKDPTYEQVCGDATGHAEVVRVRYDPKKISYEELLDAFWKMHDPTTRNRQGPDVGSQYRSIVLATTDEQLATARAAKKKLNRAREGERPIVTEIEKAGPFYRAEEYHQNYYGKKSGRCGLRRCF